MVFFATLSLIFAKAVLIGMSITALDSNRLPIPYGIQAILILTSLFLPQFIIALYSTIGMKLNSIKLIYEHCELLLLPTGIQDTGKA